MCWSIVNSNVQKYIKVFMNRVFLAGHIISDLILIEDYNSANKYSFLKRFKDFVCFEVSVISYEGTTFGFALEFDSSSLGNMQKA